MFGDVDWHVENVLLNAERKWGGRYAALTELFPSQLATIYAAVPEDVRGFVEGLEPDKLVALAAQGPE